MVPGHLQGRHDDRLEGQFSWNTRREAELCQRGERWRDLPKQPRSQPAPVACHCRVCLDQTRQDFVRGLTAQRVQGLIRPVVVVSVFCLCF